jgi:hypothetical protein
VGEWRYSSTHSSTSILDGGEWSASHPGIPCYPLDRRLGVPQSHSGFSGEEKNSQLLLGIDLRTPIFQPIAQHYLHNIINIMVIYTTLNAQMFKYFATVSNIKTHSTHFITLGSIIIMIHAKY